MAERQALGIDINDYARTGGVNFERYKRLIRNGEVDFLIIKAGLGKLRSPVFNEQRQNAELYGIPYVTYHLIDPEQNIKEQAQSYVDWVGTGDPAYIFDVEKPRKKTRPPNRKELLRYIKRLTALINKEPILYSRMEILEDTNFVDEARHFRLWIAQYPYVIDQYPQNKVQYKYFNQFLADYDHRLPITVQGTPLADKVILWQFSEYGDGYHYIYNELTEDPRHPEGKKAAALNISIHGREALLTELFGSVPSSRGGTRSAIEIQPDPPITPTYPDIDNQDMINIFFEAAAPFTSAPWRDWIVPAQLEYIGIPTANRSKPYTGPIIDDLPGLKPEHKQAILALIHPTDNKSRHAERPYEGKTNQDMITLIFKAALPFTAKPWEDWIVPAGLESMGNPAENRGKPYTGPRVEDLPNLTTEQKNAILALL